jgi:hypothetical protein
MGRVAMVGSALLLACGGAQSPELKLGSDVGLTPLKGYTRATLDTSGCVSADCRIAFARDVQISTESETDGLAAYVKAIDLDFERLSFEDDDTGEPLSFDTQVREVNVNLAQGVMLSKLDLMNLPHTVRLEGQAMETMREQMATHQPATLTASVVLLLSAPLPSHLLLRYWVQPVLIIGGQ